MQRRASVTGSLGFLDAAPALAGEELLRVLIESKSIAPLQGADIFFNLIRRYAAGKRRNPTSGFTRRRD
jgi:hypothetical protein